jgi:DNA-binding transcriptional LysR family regulator
MGRLTEAGELFLPRAKALLRSAAQAAAYTRAAAEPSRITIAARRRHLFSLVMDGLAHPPTSPGAAADPSTSSDGPRDGA